MTPRLKSGLLIAISILSLIVLFFIHPVAQSLAFHHFADTRPCWGIPNGGNVLSNLPFLLVAFFGLVTVNKSRASGVIRVLYSVLFVGVLLTGLGSAYYHWNPNNDTLVWDRLPMTIVFMSLLSATISELVNKKLGLRLLFPLLLIGVGSVLYWHYTETTGNGDLRLYMWVQYYPMVALPLLIWWYYDPAHRRSLVALGWIVCWYVIAKLLERWDYPIYDAIGISGHTLKHLAAVVSTGYFVVLFRRKYALLPLTPPAQE